MIAKPRNQILIGNHLCRFLLVALFVAVLANNANSSEPTTAIDVAKTSSCGCCLAWIDHLKENSFSVTSKNMTMGNLTRFKLKNGIGPKTASCHTARIENYTIEGHVPAREIRRLLTERPDAIGLSVPGMPLGSPGMDFGDDREAFDVLLIRHDGSTETFASYPGSK